MAEPETPRAAAPRVERLEERAYFTDDEGTTWRVYDVAFRPPLCAPGERRAFPPPARQANYRWFVPREGYKRCYKFAPDDSRELTPEVLARQLEQAEYPATERFDPAARRPR